MARARDFHADERLPHLQVITDSKRMREVLQRELPGFAEGRLHLVSMKVGKVSYRRGKRCSVSYELRVEDRQTGESGRQLLTGLTAPAGTIEARYTKAKPTASCKPRFGPALHWVRDLDLLLWGFPNDPELPRLPRLVDPAAQAELFERHWPSLRQHSDQLLSEFQTELVKYAPRERCTFRHRFELRDGTELTVYSKMFGDDTSAGLLFDVIRTLWEDSVSAPGRLMIPEPILLDPEMNTIFIRGLEGSNLDQCFDKVDLPDVAGVAGAGLAAIHQCRIAGLPPAPDEYFLDKLASTEKTIRDVEPEYAAQIEAIATSLRERHSRWAPIEPAPIHGAFRLSQLLLVQDRLALIDLDGFEVGNPIIDVAGFVAHLMYLPLKGRLPSEQSRPAIQAFCRSYAENSPWGLPADVFSWYVAIALVTKHAARCIKRARSGSHQMVGELLALAEGVLRGDFSVS